MKKSFIKTLLIVVMALLLVFTLVACDKKDNDKKDNKPDNDKQTTTGITAKEYFDELWTLTSEIGATEIDAEDDLAIEMGLEFAVNMRNAKDKSIYQQIDLGFDIQAIIGRNDAEKTALKVKLYDPSDSEHTEILSVYLLANDLDNLYFDFGGKHIRLPHNLVSTIWNEVMEQEGDLAAKIPGLFELPLFDDSDMTANDMINGLTSSFGEGWDLNALITGVTSTFGLDLKELLGSYDGMIATAVGLQSLFDANGNIDLKAVLGSETLGGMFAIDKTTDAQTNVTTYKADFQGMDMVVGFIDPMLNSKIEYIQFESLEELQAFYAKYGKNDSIYKIYKKGASGAYAAIRNSEDIAGVKGEAYKSYYYMKDPTKMDMIATLLGNNGGLSLSFREKEEKIQDFSITAVLSGFSSNMETTNGDGTPVRMTVVPEVAITISALKFKSAEDVKLVDMNPADYKSSIALDEQMSFEVSGITINDLSTLLTDGNDQGETSAEEEENDSLVLNHRVEIGFQGQLDLVGGATYGATTSDDEVVEAGNQTQLYAYVRIVDLATKTTTNLIHASFANGKLAIQLDEELASALVEMINENFESLGLELDGVNSFYLDLSDFNIADKFHDAVVNIATKIKDNWGKKDENAGTAADDTRPQAPWVANMVKAVQAGLTYLKTDNNIVISTDDILATVLQFTDILYKGVSDYTWGNEKFFVDTLKNPPLDPDNNTIGEMLGGLIEKCKDMIDSFFPEDEENTEGNEAVTSEEEEPSITDYVLTILYKFAQHIEIAGVELTDEDVEDGVSYYEKAVKAVLHGGVEITLDAKDGFHINVTVTVKDAHITIAEKLEVIDTTDAPLTDLYGNYEAAVEAGDASAWKELGELMEKVFPKEEQPAPPQEGDGGVDNGGEEEGGQE